MAAVFPKPRVDIYISAAETHSSIFSMGFGKDGPIKRPESNAILLLGGDHPCWGFNLEASERYLVGDHYEIVDDEQSWHNKYFMRLSEISIEYHDELNPKIWDGEEMHLDVRVTLLKSAYAFCEFLDLPDLKIAGVHFLGSNASFNYTQYSDCDVHIVIDFDESPCPELAENFFQTKKTLWNQMHERVSVMGYKVELYAEDTQNPPHAAGVYDLLKGAWITKPEKEKPDVDSTAVKSKAEALINEIDAICSTGDKADIAEMFEKLRTMRKAGLAQAGEYSAENLAFKVVRNLGYLDKLSQARRDNEDDALSLDHECPICETPAGGLDRCTVQTVNAFADFYHFPPITRDADIPITGADVVQRLTKAGLKMQHMDMDAPGKSLQQWVPSHRNGTWYVSTNGHAMALMNGELVDAEHKGPDGRRIICAVEFKR